MQKAKKKTNILLGYNKGLTIYLIKRTDTQNRAMCKSRIRQENYVKKGRVFTERIPF